MGLAINNRNTIYIDKQSIQIETDSRKFWIKRILNNKEPDPLSGQPYDLSREYWEINCKKNLVTIHEVNYYLNDGTAISHRSLSPQELTTTTMRIPPDSIADIAQKYVCSFKQTE